MENNKNNEKKVKKWVSWVIQFKNYFFKVNDHPLQQSNPLESEFW